ncbi:NAD(P)/FAD-dependent oxidoreductase [Nonomuraea salmonea]|uniref:NAD(P)/FAD-dependent oxidoreductase n=1 Tax=Nonomuraea salmonea TaxID=46181 RepID=UPI002FEC0969
MGARQRPGPEKNLDIECEVLDPADGRRFFPDFRGDDLSFLLWEPNAGVLRARRATQVTAALAQAAGVRLVRARAVPVAGDEAPYGCAVEIEGEIHHADRVVWACGGWLPELFDGLPITVTKQDTLHFAAPPQWSLPETPAWVDHGASAYGHGDVDGVGMKATSDAEGPPYEPEHGPRVVDPGSVEQARGYLRRRFPSLAELPVLFTQVCQYALTPPTPSGCWPRSRPACGCWAATRGTGSSTAPRGPVTWRACWTARTSRSRVSATIRARRAAACGRAARPGEGSRLGDRSGRLRRAQVAHAR